MSQHRVRREAKDAAAAEFSSGRLEMKNIVKEYGEGPWRKLVADNCSFSLEPGKVTTMVGPSGCGKSTLGFLIAGYEKATRGQVVLDGQPVGQPSWERLVVFQETALMPWMTTYQNLLFGPKCRGTNRREARARADELLERVGLTEFKKKYPLQLSGGMQRRAELARALINDPKVMILDEPFRGLDDMTRKLMQEYFNDLFEETQRTTLFITTDIDEAIFLGDRLLVMKNLPTAVRAAYDIDLGRPRTREGVMASSEAVEIKKLAMEALHEEALRSFSQGHSKAAQDFLDSYRKRSEEGVVESAEAGPGSDGDRSY